MGNQANKKEEGPGNDKSEEGPRHPGDGTPSLTEGRKGHRQGSIGRLEVLRGVPDLKR